MNRFPYSTCHLLIAHARHKAELADLNDDELTEMTQAICDVVGILRKTLAPLGLNSRYSLGQYVGAGLPAHLYARVVPRW